MAAAGLLAVLLRQASAALRHSVWSLALAGLLWLPLLTFIVPAWQVAILPPPDCAPHCEDAPVTIMATPAEDELQPLPAVAPEPNAFAPPFEAATIAPLTETRSFSVLQIVLLLWTLGVALVLSRLAFGTLRMWCITRDAECLTAYHWSAMTTRLRGQLDLRWHIPLYASDEISMPVTWGV